MILRWEKEWHPWFRLLQKQNKNKTTENEYFCTCTVWGRWCRTWWRILAGEPSVGEYNETRWGWSIGSSPAERVGQCYSHFPCKNTECSACERELGAGSAFQLQQAPPHLPLTPLHSVLFICQVSLHKMNVSKVSSRISELFILIFFLCESLHHVIMYSWLFTSVRACKCSCKMLLVPHPVPLFSQPLCVCLILTVTAKDEATAVRKHVSNGFHFIPLVEIIVLSQSFNEQSCTFYFC